MADLMIQKNKTRGVSVTSLYNSAAVIPQLEEDLIARRPFHLKSCCRSRKLRDGLRGRRGETAERRIRSEHDFKKAQRIFCCATACCIIRRGVPFVK
jgi:hypothetical protein